MKRLAAALVALACILAPGRAHAQAVSQYTKVVSATSTHTAVSFGLSALQVVAANDGASTAYISISGTASSSDTASVALAVCETGTWYFPTNAPISSIDITTASATTATVRVAAFTASNFQLGGVAVGSDRQPFFVKSTHCNLASGNETIGGNLTVSGSSSLPNIQGNMTTKALTSGAAAAAVVVVTVPSATTAGGKIDYCFEATDNTDFQARCGVIPFSAVNKAGTTTCTVGTVGSATEVVAVSTGTLTATWSCADGGSGALQLKATDTSSLTIGAGYDRVRYRVYGLAPSTLTVTAQ